MWCTPPFHVVCVTPTQWPSSTAPAVPPVAAISPKGSPTAKARAATNLFMCSPLCVRPECPDAPTVALGALSVEGLGRRRFVPATTDGATTGSGKLSWADGPGARGDRPAGIRPAPRAAPRRRGQCVRPQGLLGHPDHGRGGRGRPLDWRRLRPLHLEERAPAG